MTWLNNGSKSMQSCLQASLNWIHLMIENLSVLKPKRAPWVLYRISAEEIEDIMFKCIFHNAWHPVEAMRIYDDFESIFFSYGIRRGNRSQLDNAWLTYSRTTAYLMVKLEHHEFHRSPPRRHWSASAFYRQQHQTLKHKESPVYLL